LQWNTWEMRWWMHACMQSFFLERKQNWHAFVLLQRNKVSESVIKKNNPWDVCLCNREECCPRWERSCESSLSLSLDTICLRVS
jgi:hypothetical protein